MKMKSVFYGLALAGVFLSGITDVEAGRTRRGRETAASQEENRVESTNVVTPVQQENRYGSTNVVTPVQQENRYGFTNVVTPVQQENRYESNRPSSEGIDPVKAVVLCISIIDESTELEESEKISMFKEILKTIGEKDITTRNNILKMCDAMSEEGGETFTERVDEKRVSRVKKYNLISDY